MAAEPYASLPLATPDTIRVLYVDKSDTFTSDELVGVLDVVRLDENPTFDALSYVWGARTEPARKIICGTNEIEITDNCHSALLHLQRKLERLTIWVDSICIDQRNEAEKQHQIPLMRAIYSGANHVYIWTGTGTKETQTALMFLSTGILRECFFKDDNPALGIEPDVRKAYQKLYWSPRYISLEKSKSATAITVRLKTDDGVLKLNTDDLTRLLQNEWVTRVWTFQEVMLAENPIVVSGDVHVPWVFFAMSLMFLDHVFASRLGQGRRFDGKSLDGLSRELTIWKEITICREHFHPQPATVGAAESNMPDGILRQYHNFLQKIRLRYGRRWSHKYDVSLCLGAMLMLLFYVIGILRSLWALVGFIGFFLPYFALKCHTFVRNHTGYPNIYGSQFLYVEPAMSILSAALHRKATDPKDFFFGLQGALETSLSSKLSSVNLSSNEESIYRELAASLLSITHSVDIIKAAIQSKSCSELSWVPYWPDIKCQWRLTSSLPAMPAGYYLRRPPSASYNPAKESVLLQGIILYQVSDLYSLKATRSSTFRLDDDRIHNFVIVARLFRWNLMVDRFAKSLTWLPQWIAHDFRKQHTQGLYDMISIPLVNIMEQFWNDENQLKHLNKKHLRAYVHFMSFKEHSRPQESLALLQTSGYTTMKQPYLRHSDKVFYADILRTHDAFCDFLIATDSVSFECSPLQPYPGSNLPRKTGGICRNGAAIGDHIALIHGISIPIILRPTEEFHKLIAPAVVFGIMHGEAVIPKSADSTTDYAELGPIWVN